MKNKELSFSIFTKLWKNQTKEELADIVTNLGYNAIEFPLRPGYQVEPDKAEKDLPAFVKYLASRGIKITSVASSTTENIFAACANSGIELIRIMFGFDIKKESYMECETKWKKELEALLPLCEKYKVKVGVQQHFGPMVSTSMELRHLLEGFDPKYIGAIWDAAHSGLAGEEPEQALDIVWDYLVLANFKNAYYAQYSGLEAKKLNWKRYFTTGGIGLCDWERAVSFLHKKGYNGVFCLPAEYNDEARTCEYAKEDITYLKSLVNKYYL